MFRHTFTIHDKSDGPERHQCQSCSKSFARKAHMLRHQQQHAAQKPFSCPFCSKSFKRSDVLRAHQFRCKERGNLPVPEGQVKGRKRSSCTSCVKLRTKCDQETPCSRCRELGKECVRSREQETPGSKNREAIPIHHLLNSPPGDTIIGRFPIRDLSVDSTDKIDELEPTNTENSLEIRDYEDIFLGADFAFDLFFNTPENLTLGLNHWLGASPLADPHFDIMTQNPSAEALEPRAIEIQHLLQETLSAMNAIPEAENGTDIGTSISQLTGSEIQTCVDLFFQKYHRHCPIIHTPSFNPARAPLPLLLSVMALGAMYSPELPRVQRMRNVLDIIEYYVFRLPGIKISYGDDFDLSKAADAETLQYQFEIFQGAYLMVITQYFSGNFEARRRARRYRIARVFQIARSFGLPTAQHGSVVALLDESSFQAWIRQETRIRTMNVMLAFDAAMGFFNNIPPRISHSEIDLQLPCDSQYYELASYQEMMIRGDCPRPKMKVLHGLQKLFLPQDEMGESVEKGSLNFWDMLLIVHALYTHAWNQTFSNPLCRTSPSKLSVTSTILEPLKLAVSNWKVIWDDIIASTSAGERRSMGFETSADSYWTVIKLLISRLDSKENRIDWDSGSSDDSRGNSGILDCLPLETDCDSQGAHLRKILKRSR